MEKGEGSGCEFDYECSSGLYCEDDADAMTTVCKPTEKNGIGVSCILNDACTGALICVDSDCALPTISLLDPCQYTSDCGEVGQDTYVCRNNMCSFPDALEEGASCEDDY